MLPLNKSFLIVDAGSSLPPNEFLPKLKLHASVCPNKESPRFDELVVAPKEFPKLKDDPRELLLAS